MELQARAKAVGLKPCDLVFLGGFDRVPALLAHSAMLVLSSDYEGFPNVILEAMSARLPVVTVPAGDAGLIVRHGQTGFLVGAENIRDMAGALVRLAQSPELRQHLGEAGRRCVEEDYHCGPLAERLLGAFRRFAIRQRRLSLCESLAREEDAPAPVTAPRGGDFENSRGADPNPMPAREPFTTNL
jgi:glycosyltransferase involved in cell wall biosynthesis